MTSLYVDRRGTSIEWESGALLMKLPDGRRLSTPGGQLERLVVSAQATMSTRVLSELWRNGAGLVVLSGLGLEPTAMLLGKPHADVRIRLAQYALSCQGEEGRNRLSADLVAAKIRAQGRFLAKARTARPDRALELTRGIDAIATLGRRLEEARGDISRAALMGIEGAAASAYFPALVSIFAPALGFVGRRRRPPPDPVNACLSLVYTLGYVDAAREAQVAGLDPMLGFFHAPSYGRASLASDLVEPIRAHLDEFVWGLFRNGDLRAEDFSVSSRGCRLGKAGRGRFYAAWEARAPVYRRLLRRLARLTVAAVTDAASGIEARVAVGEGDDHE